MDRLFLLVVLLPTALSVLYFGFLASDVYISESRFIVRSPDKPSTSGLGVLLESAGFSSAGEEMFAAHEYVQSRDALKSLNRDGSVVQAYGGDDIFILDRFNPFGLQDSFEDLYDYYRDKVAVEYATTSSITTLRVRAFDPQDAHRMNRELLESSEQLVNRLNARGRADLVQFAAQEVREAELAARQAALSLAQFRNERGIIDPERQAEVQLRLVSELENELIGARTQLAQLQSIAPDNPQIPVLEVRVAQLTREIARQQGEVAGNRRSLSANAAQFQRLQLEREFADRQLASAMTSLQQARDEARRQQVYVDRIVQPSLPDDPQEPRRLRGILATLIIALVAWAIMKMLLAGMREHYG